MYYIAYVLASVPTLGFVLCPGVYKNARDWLMRTFELSEDQAMTLLTVACDFQVHQVRACWPDQLVVCLVHNLASRCMS